MTTPSLAPLRLILLNAPQQCSSFVVITLFNFFISDIILEREHVHMFYLVPSLGVHKTLICKYHRVLHVMECELRRT